MVSAYMAIPIDQYLGDTPKNTLVTNHKHRDPTSTFHCIRPPWPWPFGTLSPAGARLCGINSYNLGRPSAQLAHFFWSYFRAVEQLGFALGSPVDLVIPGGALGNTAAAFMAKEMLGIAEVVRFFV